MLVKAILIAAITVMTLSGCQENASETARDVSDAREDSAENVAETREDANQAVNSAQRDIADARQDVNKSDQNAREELTEAQSDALTVAAHADFDIAEAQAEGRSEVALERCDALTGDAKDSCTDNAKAMLDTELAAAASTRDKKLAAGRPL